VIVIGELRDLETISLAVTAAETGHLVLATLHTSNAIRTINRLLGVFPPDQLCQIRRMLSESLKVVISQRLVERSDGLGQVAALEVMVNNNAVANLIRENRTHQIKSILQTGGGQGQQLMDASLMKLMKTKVITQKEALKHAEESRNFE
jgi:twitching motility protein PilT